MIIGVPKEVKDHEYRVGLTPDGARILVSLGHRVLIESTAGIGSGFADVEYREAGAELIASAPTLFETAELVVKVKDPLVDECRLLRPGQTLFTYLHLASLPEVTRALMEARVVAIARETTALADGSLPMLKPMSDIAGRMSVQIGAHYLESRDGGRGLLLGGVPGVAPADVVVLGAGVVGSAAARIAVGMGARVSVIDRDVERLRALDAEYHGRVITLVANQPTIDRAVVEADLLVGAVLVAGAKAPMLVSRATVSRMRRGAVIVDVAVDQGGCCETTRPTTHSDPIHDVEGVLHYGVSNIPGIVPRTATMALTNATLPFIIRLASEGIRQAIRSEPALAKGVNVYEGKVTCQPVAEAQGLPYHPLTEWGDLL